MFQGIELRATEIVCRGLGPLYDLLYGNLGKSLHLSDSKKSMIQDSAASCRKYLVEESRSIEHDLLDGYLSAVKAAGFESLLSLVRSTTSRTFG